MRTWTLTRTAPFLLLAALACGGEAEQPAIEETGAMGAPAVSPDVPTALPADSVDAVMAAAVANALEEASANADSILAANGLTAERWEAILYAIAGDSTLSARYSAARN